MTGGVDQDFDQSTCSFVLNDCGIAKQHPQGDAALLYCCHMRFRIFIYVAWLMGLIVPAGAQAAEYSFTMPSTPYEVVVLGSDVHSAREHYGVLSGDPVLYELVVEKPLTLAVRLSQFSPSGAPEPLRLLMVRAPRTGRVEEVLRVTPVATDWNTRADRILGISWQSLEMQRIDVTPGVYRVEVSAPTNEGTYQLLLGETMRPIGYFATWGRITAVHNFLGLGVLTLFSSYFVLAHGLVVLLVVLWWRYGRPWLRARRTNSV